MCAPSWFYLQKIGLLALKLQSFSSNVLFMHKWIDCYVASLEIMCEMRVVQL